MIPYILAIDIGTTSTKVLAVLANGQVIGNNQSFYPTRYPTPGFVEQDPWQILQAVMDCMGSVLTSISSDYALKGICFSSAMHSLMAVDQLGDPISPLIIWADTRSSQQAYALRNTQLGHVLHDRTGTAVHPMSPLCKLLWWKENHPALLQAFKFISIKEFILFKLTGQYCIDYSIASATGLFDIVNLQWLKEAINLVGIHEDQLSGPVPGDRAIFIKNKNLAFYSIVKDTPVFSGASDGCLAQLGSDALDAGTLTITLGTSGAVRRVAAPGLLDSERKLFRYLLYPDTIITGGATNNGTVVLDWFAREFESNLDLVSVVEKATTAPPGCDGLMALPYLLGERAPIYDPYARGVFFNVSPIHTRAHFVRALMEAICYEIRSLVESVEKVCGLSQKIIVSGGFTHAQGWVQMVCDIINKDVIQSGVHDASAMGAARLAFQALGIPFSPQALEWTRYTPNSGLMIYNQQYKRFIELYNNLRPVFESINR